MTLARVTTWADGQTLTAAALNGEFDNIINNPAALVGGVANGISKVMGLQGTVSSGAAQFCALGYQMRSTSQIYSVVATSSFTILAQTAGPAISARDQSSAFASTSVHYYAIATGVNSTAPQGIVSSKPPPLGPTMPTNYSAWTYLASVPYTPASSGLTAGSGQVYINGRSVQYDGATLPFFIGSGVPTGAGVYSTSPTGDVADGVPSIATEVDVSVQISALPVAAGGNTSIDFGIATASSATFSRQMGFTEVSTARMTRYFPQVSLPLFNFTPKAYYNVAINTGTSGTLSASVLGYKVPNGDA